MADKWQLPPPIKLAKVKANGKRYIVKTMEWTRVRCFGEIEQVSGASVRHGPDRLFLLEKVEISEVERDKELLEELWKQNEESWKLHLEDVQRRKVLAHKRQYVTQSGHLTDKAHEELEQIGKGLAETYLDYLHSGAQDVQLEDMASDTAIYCDLPLGPQEPMNLLREVATDIIFDAASKALESHSNSMVSEV